MDFRVLGPLAVEDERGQLPLDGPRVRALLALLLLRANTAVSTADLLDELWGEDLPKSGATAVQNAVVRLRKTLGTRVVTTGAGYLVRVEPGELDLARFRELVEQAGAAEPAERARLLREGLGLWRGEPLGSLGNAAFVARERARLEDERLGALEDRIDADLVLGRHADLIPELSALAAEHPLDERFRAQLILALYRSGRQAAALDVYRETRRVLAEELGLEPGPALRELERAILRQDAALDAPARPAVAEHAPTPPRRKLVWLVGLAALFAAGSATAVVLGRRGHREALPPPASTTQAHALPSTERGTSTAAARHKENPRQKARNDHPSHTASTRTAAVSTVEIVEPHTATSAKTTMPATTSLRTTTAARKRQSTTTTTTHVATTTTTTTSGDTILGPPFVSDTFDGKPDETFWHIFTQGGGPEATQRNGRVEVSIPGNATPSDNYGQISGNYESRCSLPGDFDAEVDYDLLQWPRGDGVAAQLVARIGPRPGAPRYIFPQISRRSLVGGEDQYQSYLFVGDVQFASDDRQGRLRIARSDGVLTTYYWKRERWLKVDSALHPGPALISFDIGTDGATFGRLDVTVAFDNFTLFASRTECN